jgi:hypothetical protein
MKKTNVLISLVASLFISTSATATIPTTQLVKAQPIQLANLNVVHATLTSSMSTLKITTDYSHSIKAYPITLKKQQTNQIKTVKVASNEVVAD